MILLEQALRQMSPMKSPGSDGFESGFYQNYWVTVKEETCKAVLRVVNEPVYSIGRSVLARLYLNRI